MENKTSKPSSPAVQPNRQAGRYIKYAIGEVALVMIGILLALQINNWNDQRKVRKTERSILKEISTSIDENIEDAQKTIAFQDGLKRKIKRLYDHFESEKPNEPFLDSLWVATAYAYSISFENSGYELLERKGIDIISNLDLKKEIIRHFGSEKDEIMSKIDADINASFNFRHHLFKYVYPILNEDDWDAYIPLNEILIPIDYNLILNDKELKWMILHRGKQKLRSEAYVKEYLEKRKALKVLIDRELGNDY